jgi:hypothetical protein
MNFEGACISFAPFRTFCEPRSNFRDFTTKKRAMYAYIPEIGGGFFEGVIRVPVVYFQA